MARLSVEHYKSNPGTPRPERKTNRFREIFKHHPSSSASSSPNLLTKAQSASSPAMPPTMQPGFEKIGILPSERSSFEAARRILDQFGGPTFSEMLRDDMRDYGSRRTSGATTAPAVHETPAKAHTKDLEMKRIATGPSSSPLPGTAIQNAIDIGSSPPAPLSCSVTKDIIDLEGTLFKRFSQADAPSLDLSAPALTADESFISCNDHDSHRKSFASNIFDDDDSLSQGIREYVASKIAKAISEHEVKLANEKQEVADMHMQSNTKFSLYMATHKAVNKFIGHDRARIDLWTSSRSIGPFLIYHARAANLLQYATIMFLAINILGAALSGPKDLFVTLWRLIVVLGMYAVAFKYFGWGEYIGQDLLLAPSIYVGQELLVLGKIMKGEFDEPTKSTSASAATNPK